MKKCRVKWYWITLGLFSLLTSIDGDDRTKRKIYEPIEGALACFRRMNATHQIGCSSKLTGNVGVLHLVNSPESLKWVVKDGPHSPYVPLIYAHSFNRENLISFRESGRVSGVLLLRNTTKELTSFSTDNTCPNRGFGLYTKEKEKHYCENWNPAGNGLLYEDWDFPIFLINEEDQGEKLIECFETFNAPTDGIPKDWPLCAAQLQSHMLAAVDSKTCIRRTNIFSFQPSKICDPLGDYNIWGSLVARNQTQPYKQSAKGSVIVIGARLDASSMFDKLTPGADSAATGLVAFINIIKHLSVIKEKLSESKDIENVYFILFNGEAFDYIGSSRIVYDMMKDSFPFEVKDNSSSQPAVLKLENIRYFIELNQVGFDGDATYFVHTANSTEVEQLIQELGVQGKTVNISIAASTENVNKGIPPSSLQTFLAQRSTLPGIVVTNYNSVFRNKYYNSIYDDNVTIHYTYMNGSEVGPKSIQGNIAALSVAIARTVEKLIIPEDSKSLIIPDDDDANFVDELLYCYISSAKCKLFQEVAGHDQLQPFSFPLYVGVHYNMNPISIFTRNLLAMYQGTNVSTDLNECVRDIDKQALDYIWINEACYETTVNWSSALSPAFRYDGDINWDEWNSGLYSTWTESIWQKFTVRIFLKPSFTHEMLTLGFGIGVFLVSFIIIGWISKKSDVIFQSRPDMIC